jgi:hypothetical protein
MAAEERKGRELQRALLSCEQKLIMMESRVKDVSSDAARCKEMKEKMEGESGDCVRE